jgi:uncharacterized protein
VKRHYWFVILTYIVMQFSSIVGVPLLLKLGIGRDQNIAVATVTAAGYWFVISFALALIIILYLMRKDARESLRGERPASIGVSFIWVIAGIFMAMFAQSIAATIELRIFGVDPGSENTQTIMNVVRVTPILILVVSIIGPILEEIIFRKVLFGALYEKTNYFIAALTSSVIFAFVHGEPQHLLLYSAVGFTFAFLYVKTKRIIVPILAHVSMNTFVVIIQLNVDIEQLQQTTQQVQSTFGG